MTKGFQAPQCECGHKSGDHGTGSARTIASLMRGATSGGRCFIKGCDCQAFAEVKTGEEPDRAAA